MVSGKGNGTCRYKCKGKGMVKGKCKGNGKVSVSVRLRVREVLA